MAFTPRLTDAGMQGSQWWYSSGNPFYPTYGLPNCTCYAYGRYAEARGAFAPLPTRNAGLWWDLATRFSKGQSPRLGSVVCYNPGPSSTEVGHVAIVEVINSDGSIVISQSAYGGTYFLTETVYPANGYLSNWMSNYGYYCAGFIYNDIDGSTISPYVIAAICGCWMEESGLNPGIWESLIPCAWDFQYDYTGKGGYGFGQWTNVKTPHGRCYNLHTWVTSNGYADGDGNGQIAFMMHEGYWTARNSSMGFNTLADFLASTSTNLDALVKDFLACWEGVPGNKLAKRQQNAREFFAYIQNHWSDDPSQYSFVSANRYLSTTETYNNLMCIYFNLIGTPVPPGPGPGPGPSGHLIWGGVRDVLRRLIIHA